jgi:hypothetical protein
MAKHIYKRETHLLVGGGGGNVRTITATIQLKKKYLAASLKELDANTKCLAVYRQ